MYKINVNEFVKNNSAKIISTDQLKEINGGCSRITIGRCLKNGTYYVASVSGKCSSYSKHLSNTYSSAKNSKMSNGQYYDWPDGSIHGYG